MLQRNFRIALLSAVLLVVAAYSNHFGNSFHFDDSHTAEDNVYIRDLRNPPGVVAALAVYVCWPATRR
jgi:protein O-mannosyl-transferase